MQLFSCEAKALFILTIDLTEANTHFAKLNESYLAYFVKVYIYILQLTVPRCVIRGITSTAGDGTGRSCS